MPVATTFFLTIHILALNQGLIKIQGCSKHLENEMPQKFLKN